MREELLEYYERELTYLRQMGGEFARKYPKVAGRLLLDPDRCDDPHVSRLLEDSRFLPRAFIAASTTIFRRSAKR